MSNSISQSVWNAEKQKAILQDLEAQAALDQQFATEVEEPADERAAIENEERLPAIGASTLSELRTQYQRRLREPIIDGLIRRGETLNVIGAPKVGKSWFAYQVAYAVATGGRFLDRFDCRRSTVLLIDNELHAETLAYRLDETGDALSVPIRDRDGILVHCLRGECRSFQTIADIIDNHTDHDIGLVIVDAFYRMLPPGVSENDNAGMTSVYNLIDQYAARIGAAWLNVHHSSKGNQGDKAITDVGAGAGSQSRATDTHAVIRPHQDDGVFVLDAALRSFAPIKPIGMRWTFPTWNVDVGVDTSRLETSQSRQSAAADDRKNDIKTKVVATLAGGRELSTDQLQEEIATLTDHYAKRLLPELVDEGHLLREERKIGRGKPYFYRLSEPEC